MNNFIIILKFALFIKKKDSTGQRVFGDINNVTKKSTLHNNCQFHVIGDHQTMCINNLMNI